MITLPTQLANFMKGKDLAGLKPFALLYRNKWDSVNNKFALEDTPIDISALIAKPNTLSMTLDVNEVAQYNANNVTLTLEDTKNFFVEGTPNSYFPDGYQVYGSKVVLYYGITSPINPYPTQVGYTVVGSPTITDGVASGFASGSYITTEGDTDFNQHFEISISCIKGPNRNQSIFSRRTQNNGVDVTFPYNDRCTIRLWLNNSVIYNVNEDMGGFALEENTKYIMKFTYDGDDRYYFAILNNITKDILYSRTIIESTKLNNCGVTFGGVFGGSALYNPWKGSIDFNETYIKVNGEYWFNGAHFFWKNNSTPLFTGVIKELPAHKPDKYQVDLKLVSPLEMLKDIEAKDFSDKENGETLTYKSTESDGHRVYWTTGTGVGGFDAVYANGTKLFEGVDYETDQLNALGLPAIVTIINSTYYSSTITADYYTWKTGLTVEQIVAGLVGLAGYDTGTEDIRNVVWNTEVRNPPVDTSFLASVGYYENADNEYRFNWKPTRNGLWNYTTSGSFLSKLTSNWDYSFVANVTNEGQFSSANIGATIISIGDNYNGNNIPGSEIGLPSYAIGVVGVNNGISVRIVYARGTFSSSYHLVRRVLIHKITNGNYSLLAYYDLPANTTRINTGNIKIERRGSTVKVYREGAEIAQTTIAGTTDYHYQGEYRVGSSGDVKDFWVYNQVWNIYDNNLRSLAGDITRPCFISDICDKTESGVSWGEIDAELEGDASYFLNVYVSTDLISWSGPISSALNSVLGYNQRYLYYVLGVQTGPNAGLNIKNPTTYYLATNLFLQLVNLTGSTVLEALQDFALISGYEFGVDRQGVFFFRPRLSSTLPVYVLDHSELVKVDSVKKNLSDFFTKLTLTFAEVPLEFYANTGARPTPIDKYGVINKEIDKPDIVNYDNPELAQAIGPQLLEVYSALPSVIQATGKLNLALELADVVSLRRNYNLIADPEGTEFEKYINQQTYYRACKITGLNYNFSKKQITYTLRDVTDSYPNPQPGDLYEFVYDLPIRLGVK